MKIRFKKEYAYILAGVAAGALIMFIVMLLIKGGGKNDAQNVKDPSQSSTAVSAAATATDRETQTESSSAKETVKAKLSAVRSNGWQSDNKFYSQYDISVTNDDTAAIDSWTVTFSKEGRKVINSWNCEIEESGDKIIIKPVDFNKRVEPGASAGGAGIIVESSKNEEIGDFVLMVENSAIPEQTSSGQDTQAPDDPQTSGNVPPPPQEPERPDPPVYNRPPVSDPAGRLHVEGTQLVNAAGEPVQLRGVSTHGLAWFPDYVNRDAFATLKDDWNANVIRLAMYTAEYGGYCSGGDRENLKRLIDNGVNYATELGMYVIIDWHILSDNNPQTNKSDAIQFFSEMSAKYAGYDNVIYEICNEPHWVSWDNDIKPYANEVISAIRQNDQNAVILVGTNTWSQDVTDVIGNKVDDDNVMYVLHFYAATHKDDLRNKLVSAKNAGVPIFVSECSICDASGNGGIDYDSANSWLSLMNENNISFIAWSLSNKAETSALIRSDCSKLSGWNESDLTDTGRWFRDAIRN